MTPADFNLRHLRALCKTARLGSVSAASGAVHLSQPAITQALSRMEAQVGATLFLRSRSGMFPTEAGQILASRAERALGFLASAALRSGRSSGRRQAAGFSGFDRLVTNAQLRALVALSDAGSFSEAARALGVAQPSLHRAARDLERLSGYRLFELTARGVVLTPTAEALAVASGLAFAELRQALDEIATWQGRDRGEVRVGSLPLARSQLLPLAINALTKARPALHVAVVDGAYTDLLQHLRHGRLDMIIGALRDPAPGADVTQTLLFHDRLSVVSRAGHPLTAQPEVTVRDLAERPWVIPATGIPTRGHFDALFRSAGLPSPAPLVETSSLILLRELLLRSDRLTLISAHQIRHEIELGSLAVLPFALTDASRPIGLTTRTDWQPTSAQALFQDLLRQATVETTGAAVA